MDSQLPPGDDLAAAGDDYRERQREQSLQPVRYAPAQRTWLALGVTRSESRRVENHP